MLDQSAITTFYCISPKFHLRTLGQQGLSITKRKNGCKEPWERNTEALKS